MKGGRIIYPKGGRKGDQYIFCNREFLGIFLQMGHLRYIFAKVEIDLGHFRYSFAKGLNFNQGIIGIFCERSI